MLTIFYVRASGVCACTEYVYTWIRRCDMQTSARLTLS